MFSGADFFSGVALLAIDDEIFIENVKIIEIEYDTGKTDAIIINANAITAIVVAPPPKYKLILFIYVTYISPNVSPTIIDEIINRAVIAEDVLHDFDISTVFETVDDTRSLVMAPDGVTSSRISETLSTLVIFLI